MILEAMKRIRALEQRVDALEAENAKLKAGRVNADDDAPQRPIDQTTMQEPPRKRGGRR